jgi:hypothetical protein
VTVTIELADEPEWFDVELHEPTDRAGDGGSVLANRVSIGVPILLPFGGGPAADDPQVAEYLRLNEERYRTQLLAVPCSFTSGPEPLVGAVLTVALTSDDGPDAEQPVARCLTPRKQSRKASSRPISLELGLSASPSVRGMIGAPQQEAEETYFLLAHGEGTSDPGWLFRRTKGIDFDDVYHHSMLVTLPWQAPARARLALSASVRRRRGGIIPYTAQLPDRVREVALHRPAAGGQS